MSRILAFAGSNSSTSINYELVKHTVSMLNGHSVELLDAATMAIPMFSEDVEKTAGYPQVLKELKETIANVDSLVISVNEHNSSLSGFFKNLIDWLSRIDRNFLGDKKILLLSTSPGKRGGIGAQDTAKAILPRFGAEIVATFSLPSFYDNFSEATGILDAELKEKHQAAVYQFLAKI